MYSQSRFPRTSILMLYSVHTGFKNQGVYILGFILWRLLNRDFSPVAIL